MLFRLGERLTLGGRFIKQWHKRSLLSNFTLKWISGGPKTELIYEHHKPGVIMLLKFFGASQLILWPYMNYAICDLLERKKTVRRNPEGDNTTMKRISRKVAESSFFYFAQIVGMGIGLLLAGASFLVAKQTAKRVFLLGRSRVQFETYGIFIPEKFETNLEQVSAKRGRNPEALSYIPIKVSERTLYVLLDQYAGHFPVPKLYDRTVGVTRPL